MNLEYTFCRYFYAERLLLPFSVEGQVSRSDERYLYILDERKFLEFLESSSGVKTFAGYCMSHVKMF